MAPSGNVHRALLPRATLVTAARAAVAPGVHGHVCFVADAAARSDGHDSRTKAALARELAGLLDLPFRDGGDAPLPRGRAYCVPSTTLTSRLAARLGIASSADLFGGVTPMPFVATKVITHPLWHGALVAPDGWSARFAATVRPVVLDGFSVFSPTDALAAGEHLLRGGAVRVKPAGGVGGGGQTVVADRVALQSLIDVQTDASTWRDGWVLERDLEQVQTCSVGQVRIGRWLLSYHGSQRLTRNHHGHEVYGGSSLHVVRGDFDALLRRTMHDELRTAIEQALTYHRAAMACFPGLFASRCNYDVAQGRDAQGHWRSGVLEQSWRIGGASGAELAALRALSNDVSPRWFAPPPHEHYGDVAVPGDAVVHYDDTDAQAGRLIKYARVDARGDD